MPGLLLCGRGNGPPIDAGPSDTDETPGSNGADLLQASPRCGRRNGPPIDANPSDTDETPGSNGADLLQGSPRFGRGNGPPIDAGPSDSFDPRESARTDRRVQIQTLIDASLHDCTGAPGLRTVVGPAPMFSIFNLL